MSAIWGNNIHFTIFGESHGSAIGGVLDGLPAGITLDMERISDWMKRRAPGNSDLVTPRSESDIPEVLSGIFNGVTTGAPLAFLIRNNNSHSHDYSELKDKMRPSHADYPASLKYKGFQDYRGGGHFSGRLTASLVFAGAVCEQILSKEGIYTAGYIRSIGTVEGGAYSESEMNLSLSEELKGKILPIKDSEKEELARRLILEKKEEGDSVGGVIECQLHGMPGGFGNPFFDSFESMLSHLLFSVPAVKGVEFGTGFEISKMTGSRANDSMELRDGEIRLKTNHNGGITGGITNGMPVLFRVAIKPTPSIAKEQETVDISKMENTVLKVKGRHDPCIVPRAVPVIEACALLCALDALEEAKK